MSSIATATSTINVPFHGAELYVVSINNEAYTPMRPIIDGMGLTYQGQAEKLKSRFSKGVRIIMIPTKGGEQSMLCLALRKLNGWLQTISANKVKPEIRDKVIQYQEECDDVLYEYWTKGLVTNPRKAKKALPGKITSEQQEAIKQLVLSRGRSLPQDKQAKAIITLWSSLKSHFGCSYKEIDEEQFTEALSLAARVPIEGEFLGKDDQQNALAPLSYQVLCRVENGKQVKIKMFGLDKTVDDVDSWQIWMKHKGAVFLLDDKQKREFVRDQVNHYLN
ncbi:phage antirepressor N-terminal domain-containing protein [Izhakiella capsodis]|nr:phage antirepressor N-terminal domain-containing protein [Izhakiella capsodis]